MPPKKHRRGLQPRAKQSQQYECNLETASAELVEIKVLAGKPDELGDLMNATLLDAHSARNTGASTLDILGSQGDQLRNASHRVDSINLNLDIGDEYLRDLTKPFFLLQGSSESEMPVVLPARVEMYGSMTVTARTPGAVMSLV